MTAQTREEIMEEYYRAVGVAVEKQNRAESHVEWAYNRAVRAANAKRDRKLAELEAEHG